MDWEGTTPAAQSGLLEAASVFASIDRPLWIWAATLPQLAIRYAKRLARLPDARNAARTFHCRPPSWFGHCCHDPSGRQAGGLRGKPLLDPGKLGFAHALTFRARLNCRPCPTPREPACPVRSRETSRLVGAGSFSGSRLARHCQAAGLNRLTRKAVRQQCRQARERQRRSQ